MKKLLIILCAAAMLFSLCACELLDSLTEYGDVLVDAAEANRNPGKIKTYSHAGVSFELPNSFLDFTGKEIAGDYPFLYANDEIGILGIQENKAEYEAVLGQTDLRGYAETIAELYELDTTVTEKDGFITFTYETESEGEMQTFVCVFYETDTDFWNIQGYCESDIYPLNEDDIWEYLTSATID